MWLYAVALAGGERIDVEDLPEELRVMLPKPVASGNIASMEEVERNYILSVLEAMDGNKTRTAEALNIGIATLYRKLSSYEKENKSF